MSDSHDVWLRPEDGDPNDVILRPYGPDEAGNVFVKSGGAAAGTSAGGQKFVDLVKQGGAAFDSVGGGARYVDASKSGGAISTLISGGTSTRLLSKSGGAIRAQVGGGVSFKVAFKRGGGISTRVSSGESHIAVVKNGGGKIALKGGGVKSVVAPGGEPEPQPEVEQGAGGRIIGGPAFITERQRFAGELVPGRIEVQRFDGEVFITRPQVFPGVAFSTKTDRHRYEAVRLSGERYSNVLREDEELMLML